MLRFRFSYGSCVKMKRMRIIVNRFSFRFDEIVYPCLVDPYPYSSFFLLLFFDFFLRKKTKEEKYLTSLKILRRDDRVKKISEIFLRLCFITCVLSFFSSYESNGQRKREMKRKKRSSSAYRSICKSRFGLIAREGEIVGESTRTGIP